MSPTVTDGPLVTVRMSDGKVTIFLFEVATIISIYFDYRLIRGLPLDFSMSRTHRLNVRTYVVRHMQLVWQMEAGGLF